MALSVPEPEAQRLDSKQSALSAANAEDANDDDDGLQDDPKSCKLAEALFAVMDVDSSGTIDNEELLIAYVRISLFFHCE